MSGSHSVFLWNQVELQCWIICDRIALLTSVNPLFFKIFLNSVAYSSSYWTSFCRFPSAHLSLVQSNWLVFLYYLCKSLHFPLFLLHKFRKCILTHNEARELVLWHLLWYSCLPIHFFQQGPALALSVSISSSITWGGEYS